MATVTDQISYQDLYARWERGNWSAMEIDFSEDRRQWQEEMTEFERKAALWNYALFFFGEDAVTDGLSPYIDAAPLEEQKYFLATQQVDEARHAVFFSRFMHEVCDVGGGTVGDGLEAIKPELTWGLRRCSAASSRMADELREDPSLPNLAAAVTLYHLVIEATLAQPGQHFITSYLHERDLLPGFREGMDRIAQDEQRHIGFGVKLLADICRPGPALQVRRRRHAARGDPATRRRAGSTGMGPPLHRGVRLRRSRRSRSRAPSRSRPSCAAPAFRSTSSRARRSSRPTCRPKSACERVCASCSRACWARRTARRSSDPDTMAALFQLVRAQPRQARAARRSPARSSGTSRTPSRGTWWSSNGDTPRRARLAPSARPSPSSCRYEDWADVVGGRENPLSLAARRRIRPKGDFRWLWRARSMFPR